MTEVEIYGAGKGAAQVFNTSGSLRLHGQLMQQRAYIQQRDQAMLQNMVNTYDPNKQDLRTADVQDYQQIYTEWKKLHLDNKELMKNPAKFPDQFRQAEDLKTKMNFIARGSQEIHKFTGEFSKMALTDPDKFTDGSVELTNSWGNKSTMQIYQELGHLPTYGDVELKAKAPKKEEIISLVENVAKDNNAITYGAVEIGKGRNVGVGDFEILVRPFKKIKPEAVNIAYEMGVGADGNMQKFYNQKFKNSTPEQVAVLQEQVFKNFGFQMPIENGEDFGKATWMVEAGIIQDKERVEKDEAALAKKEMDEFIQKKEIDKKYDIAAEGRAEARARRTALFTKSLQGTPKTEQDGLYDESIGIVDALKKGDAATYNKAVTNFNKRIPPSLRANVKTFNPKNMTEEDYVTAYKRYLKEAPEGVAKMRNPSGDGTYFRGENWIRNSYRQGVSIMFLPVYDEKDEKKFIPIDPMEEGSSETLFNVLNNQFKFSQKSTTEKTGTNRK